MGFVNDSNLRRGISLWGHRSQSKRIEPWEELLEPSERATTQRALSTMRISDKKIRKRRSRHSFWTSLAPIELGSSDSPCIGVESEAVTVFRTVDCLEFFWKRQRMDVGVGNFARVDVQVKAKRYWL